MLYVCVCLLLKTGAQEHIKHTETGQCAQKRHWSPPLPTATGGSQEQHVIMGREKQGSGSGRSVNRARYKRHCSTECSGTLQSKQITEGGGLVTSTSPSLGRLAAGEEGCVTSRCLVDSTPDRSTASWSFS